MSYFGKLAATEAGPKAIEAAVSRLMSRQNWGKKSIKHPLRWLSFVTGLLGNKWHGSMAKAQMTGLILADLIARTESKDGFILMGHSLGARVIHSLLSALSTMDRNFIKEVYLLGGAVDARGERLRRPLTDGYTTYIQTKTMCCACFIEGQTRS
jgi:hypothetical protein